MFEIKRRGAIYTRVSQIGGAPTPIGARWAGSRKALPFGRPPVYK